jgi:hypothetical protein
MPVVYPAGTRQFRSDRELSEGELEWGSVMSVSVMNGTNTAGGLLMVRFVNAIYSKSRIETGTASQCDCVPYTSGLVFS